MTIAEDEEFVRREFKRIDALRAPVDYDDTISLMIKPVQFELLIKEIRGLREAVERLRPQ